MDLQDSGEVVIEEQLVVVRGMQCSAREVEAGEHITTLVGDRWETARTSFVSADSSFPSICAGCEIIPTKDDDKTDGNAMVGRSMHETNRMSRRNTFMKRTSYTTVLLSQKTSSALMIGEKRLEMTGVDRNKSTVHVVMDVILAGRLVTFAGSSMVPRRTALMFGEKKKRWMMPKKKVMWGRVPRRLC